MLYVDEALGVVDGRVYFEPVAYYGGIGGEVGYFVVVVGGDLMDVEMVECGAEGFAFVEYTFP